jgi:hypothetical protein
MTAYGATSPLAAGATKDRNPPQTDVQPNAAAEDRVSRSLYRIAKIASFTSYPLVMRVFERALSTEEMANAAG